MRVGAIRVRPKAQSAPQAPMRAQNPAPEPRGAPKPRGTLGAPQAGAEPSARSEAGAAEGRPGPGLGRQMCRSEEHTSELQSLMRISYAVFCLQKNIPNTTLLSEYINNEYIS